MFGWFEHKDKTDDKKARDDSAQGDKRGGKKGMPPLGGSGKLGEQLAGANGDGKVGAGGAQGQLSRQERQELKQLMKPRQLATEQIARARALSGRLPTKEQGDQYQALQAKVPYENQPYPWEQVETHTMRWIASFSR